MRRMSRVAAGGERRRRRRRRRGGEGGGTKADAEPADAATIAVVAARRDYAAGRHCRSVISGRDDAPSHIVEM
jgi:hypothetical protein